MKQQEGRTQFAIEDQDGRGKIGRVWLRKFSDVFVPLGHLSCILEDARRNRSSVLALEVAAWWQRALTADEPIPVYNPLCEEEEWKKAQDRPHDRTTPRISVTDYDYEELKDLMESFELALVSK